MSLTGVCEFLDCKSPAEFGVWCAPHYREAGLRIRQYD